MKPTLIVLLLTITAAQAGEQMRVYGAGGHHQTLKCEEAELTTTAPAGCRQHRRKLRQ
jgi:hypothetical protein